jgi:hypothetical protein
MIHKSFCRFIITIVVGLFLPSLCSAQPRSLVGTFYVSVDDVAKLFVDGKEVYVAKYGESRSGELELKVGSRVVARVANEVGKRRFMLAFLSTNRGTVVNFKHRDFKIVTDINVTDFTPDDFAKWTKFAEEEKHEPVFQFKTLSEWVWGDLNKCTLACVITEEMIRVIGR